jgi:hypothetical protein
MTTTHYTILTQTATHRRDTLEAAEWLADSLSRYGWVEIVEHGTDEFGEGTWRVIKTIDGTEAS